LQQDKGEIEMEQTGKLKERTTFTQQHLGPKSFGKPLIWFKLTQRYVNLNIPFKWNWLHYNCENCNHVKQEMITHSIIEIGVYEPEDKKLIDTQIWMAITQDGKSMSIPETRRAELIKHLKV
jgi:hypothetical protein